jgi:DNA-binding NarL/FixJ family response regulator
MKGKARILIVDDHPTVREGLALRIDRQPDLGVCGEAASRTEALRMIEASRPDVVVVDLVLEDSSGLDLIRDIKGRHPGLPVLALSAKDECLYARRAIQAGARGYIMKREATEGVIEALRQVLAGHVYLSEQMKVRLLDGLAEGEPQAFLLPIEQLSDRELEVFRLLGEGLRTRQIAERLHLSVKTIETYYERIKLGLRLSTLNELMRHAVLWASESQRD